MKHYETIAMSVEDNGVARLFLNRPERHNALNAVMIRELTDAARELAEDATVRAVVLGGHGKSFCAGADLEWMKQQFTASGPERAVEAQSLAAMLRALDELPKLTIGVIDGAAFGGGVGLAAVCDIVIAGPAARFALTETRLGLIPATIAPYLHRRIGAAALRRFALHGAAFDADEAKAIGLVSEVAEAGEVAAAVERHATQALTCAPGAIAAAKHLFRRIAAGGMDEAATAAALASRWESTEAQAGIAAFFRKEKPSWQA